MIIGLQSPYLKTSVTRIEVKLFLITCIQKQLKEDEKGVEKKVLEGNLAE